MHGLLMPLWGRPEVSERVLAYWSRPSFDFLERVAIVSPEDPNPPAVPAGWTVVRHENRMQEKWQAGLDALMDLRADTVMMMGSDDLMTVTLTQLCHVAALERGMAYPSSIYYADPWTKEVFHAQYRTVFAGCTYDMDLVRRTAGGRIFVSEHLPGHAPDVVSAHHMRVKCPNAFGAPRCDEMGEAVVDVKAGTNVWSFDRVKYRARNRLLPAPTYDELFGTHFPGVVFSPETENLDGRQSESA